MHSVGSKGRQKVTSPDKAGTPEVVGNGYLGECGAGPLSLSQASPGDLTSPPGCPAKTNIPPDLDARLPGDGCVLQALAQPCS